MAKNEGVAHFPDIVREAVTRKYNTFCSDGARSVTCLNGFWGYYQPIRNAQYMLGEILDNDLYNFPSTLGGDIYIREAPLVMKNPSIGGQGGDLPSEWVTIKKSANPTTYGKLVNSLSVGVGDAQVMYYRKDESAGELFLVLTINQNKSQCGGEKCNMTNLP